FRYRLSVPGLPGRPDIVFASQRLVVFCDGDFWHGRNLNDRLERLARGHNAQYWVNKVRANVARDIANSAQLRKDGWCVLRLWETDIRRDPAAAAALVSELLERNRTKRRDFAMIGGCDSSSQLLPKSRIKGSVSHKPDG